MSSTLSTPSSTPDILRKILARKKQEIIERSAQVSLQDLRAELDHAPPVRGFMAALQHKHSLSGTQQIAIIAEIKKASPSKGILRQHFNAEEIASAYQRAGASCLSILTDQDFFQGHENDLKQVRQITDLPILRKDFMIDEYQVYEARVIGADCILLIVAALEDVQLQALMQLAETLGMDVLVEVHDEAEMERALKLGAPLIGINNRNLHTFAMDLSTTVRLSKMAPEDCLIVCESGINHYSDIQSILAHDVSTFLVGESLMRAADPGAALQQLLGDGGG